MKNKFSHYTYTFHFLAPLPYISNQKGKKGYPPTIPKKKKKKKINGSKKNKKANPRHIN